MAHNQQRAFFASVKAKFPASFSRVRVVDCGSLDFNGSLRPLFTDSDYTGVDIRTGKNVDIVSKVHLVPLPDGTFDTVVSGEMLEHDEHWPDSLRRMYALLKPGGLLAFSAAGAARREHGTRKKPGTHGLYGTSPHHYHNLTIADVWSALTAALFTEYSIDGGMDQPDLYFYGVKA